MPVLKAKKSLRDVPDGGVLKVLATDPGSVADMKSFCEMTGNRLISSIRKTMSLSISLKKRFPDNGVMVLPPSATFTCYT